MTYKLLTFALALSTTAFSQDRSGWGSYGGDAGGSRFSTNKQINVTNVAKLTPAWTFRTGELLQYEGNDAREDAAFEATPILANNTLYFTTASCRVFALDPATGKQKWMFDPKVDLNKGYSEVTSRGVTSWPLAEQSDLYRKYSPRIFFGTIDGRLIALDAKSGKPVTTFGNNGIINLQEGYGEHISMTSPPAVIDTFIIAGSSLGDNQQAAYPKGVIRAFSAITGKQVWEWDPVSFDTAHRTGAANAWAPLSVDVQRKMVFIPTSSPSPDYYGGQRLGNNENANSIVALDAATGKMKWSFQVVHHDLWDYDIAAQPMLVDVRINNQLTPVVVAGTKMGHIFVLHRETGKPVFGIEERAVPASNISGERASQTQPFPLLPKPLGLQKVSEADAWGPDSARHKLAVQRINRYINNGIFTPPSEQGTLVTPGNVGGIHWGGMCYNPNSQTLITNINWLAAIIRLFPREKLEAAEKEDQNLLRNETGRQSGTPYVLKRDYLFTIEDDAVFMQTQPPWGTLNAIDLGNGNEKWQVPLGYMMDTVKYPDAKKWGSLNFGGAITTAGDLVFVAATRDDHLRAFNANTGELLWEFLLPASAQATPMTYLYKGKQYVVIAAGGHGKFFTKQGDYLMGFAVQGIGNRE
jgi:quinoprotein glucose dehydrogenase